MRKYILTNDLCEGRYGGYDDLYEGGKRRKANIKNKKKNSTVIFGARNTNELKVCYERAKVC